MVAVSDEVFAHVSEEDYYKEDYNKMQLVAKEFEQMSCSHCEVKYNETYGDLKRRLTKDDAH